jgi:hypothetical protein
MLKYTKKRTAVSLTCIFPIIKDAMDNGTISVDTIALLINNDKFSTINKLCGNENFDINEAMTINLELFPDIPFKKLFSPCRLSGNNVVGQELNIIC